MSFSAFAQKQIPLSDIREFQAKVIYKTFSPWSDELDYKSNGPISSYVSAVVKQLEHISQNKSDDKKSGLEALRGKREYLFKRLSYLANFHCMLSPLPLAYSCIKIMNEILSDMKPFCAHVQLLAPWVEKLDANPCAAGGELVSSLLYQSQDMEQIRLQMFLTRLSELPEKSKVDLWQVYKAVFPKGKAQDFLAALNFFYSAAHNNIGFVDDFYFYYLQRSLNEGRSGSFVFEEYMNLKRKKSGFKRLTRGHQLYIGEVSLANWNRHNFMSAFLACYYRAKGQTVAEMIPVILGSVYESKDFVSHLEEGTSWSQSRRAFERDVRRYVESAKWGFRFCQMD
ncbi:MAG: hypothetical protein JNM93_12240 [Bacteriovoracaceae bacterium]|nr:hypothetical protein [Bacteriovoracaceae bacterium]